MFNRLRAFAQTTTYLGAAVIVATWCGVFYLTHMDHARAYEDGLRQGSNLARIFKEYISRVIGGGDSVLLTLREAYEHDPQNFDVARSIGRSQAQDNAILHFGYAGPDGNLRIADLPSTPSVSNREYFRLLSTATTDELYIGTPFVGRVSGRPIFQLARRITAPDGSFGGVFLASVDIPELEKFYSSVDIGSGGVISLSGFDGIIRARGGRDPGAKTGFGQSVAQTHAYALYRQNPAGSYWNFDNPDRQFDVVKRLISYQVVDGFPLIAVVGLAEDDIFRQSRMTAHSYYFIAIVLSAGVLVVMGIGAKRQRKLSSTVGALEESKRSLEQTNARFNTSLENMAHGLCMFDATGRLVVCNDRYRQMYKLPPDSVMPYCTLLDLLRLRATNGTFEGDPEEYIADLSATIAQGKTARQEVKTGDGRTIVVVNQPMAGGGWVATHEDVTEAKQQEASFRLLFENNPVPMWVFDRDSLRFLAVNDAAVTHYGYSHEQFLAMTIPDMCPEEDRAKFAQTLKALPDVQLDAAVGQHQKSDGTKIAVSVFSQSLSYGGHRALLAAVHDVTQQKLSEEELRRTRKFLDTIIEHVPLPISVKDVSSVAEACDFRFTLVNQAFEDLMGETRSRLIGKTAREIYAKERADLIAALDGAAIQTNKSVTLREHVMPTAAKGERVLTAWKVAVRDDGGNPQYLLTVLDDVTERKVAEQRIAHMAHYDALTDLPNRAAFNERLSATLQAAAAANQQFAVLSADLDRFKEVNDVFGHSVGDTLLRNLAKRLQAAAGDAFLARLGGDEFSFIVADGPQPAAASALADRLLAAVGEDFEVAGLQLRIGLSIGAAVYPTDSKDADALMNNADAALYRSKSEARGTVRFFEADMDMRLRERLAIQNDLRSAIDRDELLLHYQPQVRISGETVGFEALVRWQSPKRGLVPPGTFIPIAEDSSLIISIGEWVLREACREAATWTHPLRIAVNVSPIQFRYGDLPKAVHSILLETGLAPGRLELEITESVMISDFTRAVSILRRLKSLGVRIAMDDFGTGYSSLSFLQSFPCDKIKIDHAFIHDLEDSHHSIAIVRAVIGLGRSLNIPILAEGVETAIQHAFLLQAGCDEVQGYFTGRPMPISHYAALTGRQENPRQGYATAG